MKLYRHIIWDFDGTLFDSYPVMARIFSEKLSGKGIHEPEDEIMKHMKVSMTNAVEHYQKKYHISDDFIKEYEKQRRDMEIRLCRPYRGIEEVCKFIHTSGRSNYLYTHRGESSIILLKKHGLYDYFTDFITSQHGFERKPSPQAINYIVDKYNMNRDEAIMIGDRELDILSGKNAGIHACYFTEGHGKSSAADYTINDFNELYSIIE